MWFGSGSSGDPHSLLLDFVDVVFVGIVAAFLRRSCQFYSFFWVELFKDERSNVCY